MQFIGEESEEFDSLLSKCSQFGGLALQPIAVSSLACGACLVTAVSCKVGDEIERTATLNGVEVSIMNNYWDEGAS
jgi:hypothetical protein